MMITFLISGLWHGANWTFVVWGGMHGFVQVVEDVLKKPLSRIKKGKVTGAILGIVVFVICNIGWVFFRADSFGDAFYVLKNCTSGILNIKEFYHNTIGLNHLRYYMIFAMITSVGVYDYFSLKMDVPEWFAKKPIFFRVVIQYLLIALILWVGIDNLGNNTFVYFQF